ncbi:MAG: sulfatase [Bryobacteraceae bacterium]|nr:sulfatase [Bryobacteraceae bacterium]
MRIRGWFTRDGVLREALGVGALVGLAHAVAETTLFAHYGVRATALDLALLIALPLAAGIGLAALAAAVVALSPRLRRTLATPGGLPRLRSAVWTLLIAVYAAVFLKIVGSVSGASAAIMWFAAAIPILIGASMAVFRRRGGELGLVWATVCVAATFCALQILHSGWTLLPEEKRTSFALSLAAAIAICYAALIVVARRAPRSESFEPIARPLRLATACAVAWVFLWGLAYSPRSFQLVRAGNQPAGAGSAGPNVVLAVLDTVRADHLDLFGYHRETMPLLRRFAQEECQAANRLFTTGSWTVPSHASMFTGLYPSAHGADTPRLNEANPDVYSFPIRDDAPTLAEYLNERGYQTAAIGANYGTLRSLDLMRGFEYQDVAGGSAYLAGEIAWLHRFQVGAAPSPGTWLRTAMSLDMARHSRIFSRLEPPYRRADSITDRALRWLERRGDQPFFLFLNYFDAHQPYLPAPEDSEHFARRPAGTEWLDFPTERFNAARWGQAQFEPHEAEFLIGQYDAELRTLDREFARLLDYMREDGLFDNTLLLITTDHGESFFEHGFVEHGNALYQPEIGGFLLIKAPPSMGAIQPSPHMQFVDFFPTIAAALNEPAPPNLQGSAWGQGRDYALAEQSCRICGAGADFGQWPESIRRELIAVIAGDHKLIRSTRDPDEVYDLRADPSESRPLTKPDPKFLARAEQIIAERNQRVLKRRGPQPAVDSDDLERLRSLGYVQ